MTEEEFADAEAREAFYRRWREHGVEQVRLTLVNDEYPHPPYPHGVWIEGWTDKHAFMLPFGEGGSPPLTAIKPGDNSNG
jgi:hypothetical protein